MGVHFTERDIAKLPAPDKSPRLYIDDARTGLAVRVMPSGTKTYVAFYRAKKHDGGYIQRKVVLGPVGTMRLEEAREEASKYRREARKGGDLRATEEDQAADERRARQVRALGETFGQAAKRFLAEHVAGLRSAAIARLYIGIISDGVAAKENMASTKVEGLGNIKMAELTRADCQRFLDDLVKARAQKFIVRHRQKDGVEAIARKRGQQYAFAAFAHLRTFANWFASKDENWRNPIIKGMVDFKLKDLKRDRTLSDSELREVWEASHRVTPEFGAIVRLLILTGQRRGNIAAAKWDWLGRDSLDIPAAFFKTGVPHSVPLTREARALFDAQPRPKDAEYVFGLAGATPFSGFSKCKAKLDFHIAKARKIAGISKPMERWVLHDLRRTARSLMSRSGVPTDHAERVLGHEIGGVRGVYDRHAYFAEKLAALEKLAAIVAEIVSPPPSANSGASNVVELPRAKRRAGTK